LIEWDTWYPSGTHLNVEEHPDSWNTYDSLGEAYMTAGKRELAIANYTKSLELNPANSNATQMLERLKAR
jgi:cytochrome c-type biogenesis protein CcmH/NrfG